VLNGTARPDSDIDFLVEFDAGQAPGRLRLAAIEAELRSCLVGGMLIFELPKI
jgi:predicted nucleotidyltransferase